MPGQSPPGAAQDHDPLAAVRNDDGTVNWLKVGEAEQARRTRQLAKLPAAAAAVLDWLHANGGSLHVAQAAMRWDAHLRELVRQHGGTIVTDRSRTINGHQTIRREIRRFKPRVKQRSATRRV